MPIHDWTRAEAGDFHHFHQRWISAITDALNSGGLPPGFMALAEQVPGRPIPDVVTLEGRSPKGGAGGTTLAPAPPPSARVIQKYERINYAKRADRVVIRHGRGRVVAIIEIVSPGNKDSRHAIRSFVEKAADILNQGVHLVVVDLFPPTPRDPQGIHKAIWDEFGDMPFDFLPDKPLTVASYIGGDLPTAYVDSVGVGDRLPAIPLFLTEYDHVPLPLEATYEQAWAMFPAMLKELFKTPPAA
ncbi:MAG TPA: DUF4058 family protein [Urbifossiella sp.]|jgi:hypothetical protein|nr:DUF4058 family protein [Urbifossiella sp.]